VSLRQGGTITPNAMAKVKVAAITRRRHKRP
jgi:hypothetical protein